VFKYAVPIAALTKLKAMNAGHDPLSRYDALMKEDGLFTVEAIP
jgi:hypothetical protein